MERISLSAVIEASLNQLVTWQIEPPENFDSKATWLYCKIIYGYLTNNEKAVDEDTISDTHLEKEEREWILFCFHIRNEMRSKGTPKKIIEKMGHLEISDPVKNGEQHLLRAMGYHQDGENELALHSFQKAYKFFKEAKMFRRQLTCIQNEIVCKSHITPEMPLYATISSWRIGRSNSTSRISPESPFSIYRGNTKLPAQT